MSWQKGKKKKDKREFNIVIVRAVSYSCDVFLVTVIIMIKFMMMMAMTMTRRVSPPQTTATPATQPPTCFHLIRISSSAIFPVQLIFLIRTSSQQQSFHLHSDFLWQKNEKKTTKWGEEEGCSPLFCHHITSPSHKNPLTVLFLPPLPGNEILS